MSLTSYLTDPDHPGIRQKFREEFLRPPFNFKIDIKAPPLTKNYGIIGSAFDYVLRFAIQYHNNDKQVHGGQWVADISFKRLQNAFIGIEQSAFKKRYNRAKTNHEKFLKNGKITKQLLADTLFLAKLDLYIRSGMIVPNMFIESDHDITDLKNLYATINISDFIFNDRCFLNPTFGKGSLMVGGADADIILDDTLIDIKVTKHLKLEREYLNQLIGYYILSLIGAINNEYDGTLIKKIGVYFARHGILWTVPLSDFGAPKKFASFKEWFTDYFGTIRKERLIEVNKQLEVLKKQIAKKKKKPKLNRQKWQFGKLTE
jgi:hypothetical protein